MKIGSYQFESMLIQGPLAGVSCAPFRELAWEFGNVAYCCTEMLSAKDLVLRPSQPQRYVYRSPKEKVLCYQIAGNTPEVLHTASQIVTDYGADIIDLNCGCPKQKIRKKGLGSAMLSDPLNLYHCVNAMRQATEVPITVKIRLEDTGNLENINAIVDAGADAIIIHGRRWTDDYGITCNYELLKQLVEISPIPIIGNGDIACHNTLAKMQSTHCAGAMVSRAGVGQPWLFQSLINKQFNIPTLAQRGDLLLRHIDQLAQLDNTKSALLQARMLGKYYARAMNDRSRFLNELYQTQSHQQLQQVIKTFFV